MERWPQHGGPGPNPVPPAQTGAHRDRPARPIVVHHGSPPLARGGPDRGGDLGLGVHVVVADDPGTVAAAVADQLSAPLLTTATEAEATVARLRSERRAAAVADEAAEAARLAAVVAGSRHRTGHDEASEAELRAAVERGRHAAAATDEVRRLGAALSIARARVAACEERVAEVVARADRYPPGSLAGVPAPPARAAAGTVLHARREAERARRAVGDKPPDPAADAREVSQFQRSEVDVVGELARLRRLETALSPLLVLVALVAAVFALWLDLARGVPLPFVVPIPAGAVAARLAVSRRLRARLVDLEDKLREVLLHEVDSHERWREHEKAMETWNATAAEAAAAEERLAVAVREWEALAGPGADAARVEELLEHEIVARRAAEALASAEAAADDARRLSSAAEEDWGRLLARLGVDAGSDREECLAELASRQAAGARAESTLDDLRVRADAASRLRALLHGRRLERLLAEASARRPVDDSPGVVVLRDPFAGLGAGRRRQLFRDLEWWARTAALVVVTADPEAAEWAERHGGSVSSSPTSGPSASARPSDSQA